jgi:hypothetical protein
MSVVNFLSANSKAIIGTIILALVLILIFVKKDQIYTYSKEEMDGELDDEEETKEEETTLEFSESKFDGAEFTQPPVVDEISPKDLLPSSEEANVFDLSNPDSSLSATNFLTAGYNIGINTVSGTNRNANQTLREDPPIPVISTGPWNQTTIQRDETRKGLEIC